jgi:transcriptional regulator with XRE-family HTH domain
MDFAEWLSSECQLRGWSQSELARRADLKRQTVNYIFNGQSKNPDIATLKKIAKALKVNENIVLRAAHVVQPVSERTALKEELDLVINDLSPDEQRLIVSIAKGMKEGKKNNRRQKGAEAMA